MRFPFIVVAASCAVATLCGCGEDNPLGRMPISGKVTLQGQPLEAGDIKFTPVDPLGKTQSGATIAAGEYSIPTEAGLVPGMYIVRIFSATDAAAVAKDTMPGMQPTMAGRERIPPQYNVNSRLRCEVKAGEENVFDFPL